MSGGPLTDIVVFLKVCDPVSVFIRVKVWLHIGDLDIGLKRNAKYADSHNLACKGNNFSPRNSCEKFGRFIQRYRGSYMSAHVLLNLLNELGKSDKMQGLRSILSFFRNEFNKFNNTGA